MLASYFQRLFADPTSTPALIRRLLVEQAAGQWRRYALAFGLMGIAAASTALGAYLVGDVINQAYVHKNLPGIIILALVTAVIFMIKAMATELASDIPSAVSTGRRFFSRASATRLSPKISGACSTSCSSRMSAFSATATAPSSWRG